MAFYERYKESADFRCLICPHSCIISPGKRGLCGVRENNGEGIVLTTYEVISAFALDPVEKKPLYHFYPGMNIVSIGSYGCNLKCDFCQNYQISQYVEREGAYRLTPQELVNKALKAERNVGIAYTYNEPLIWHEYVLDCARIAAAHGMKNVMVTNGYFNSKPLAELLEVIDAFNIDLKAFDNEFYRKYTGATIKPVLNSLAAVKEKGKHLEITTLILPGLNDSETAMRREAEWIRSNLGRNVPLHISRYFPMYQRSDPATPSNTITRLVDIASEYLDYVYSGNLSFSECGSDTVCPSCHKTVIKRSGYYTKITGLDDEGRCINCNEPVIEFLRIKQ